MENMITPSPSPSPKPRNNWIAVSIGLIGLFLFASGITKQREADASWPYRHPYFLSTELPQPGSSVYSRGSGPSSKQGTDNQGGQTLSRYTAPDGSFQVLFPPKPTIKAEPLAGQPSLTKNSYTGCLGSKFYHVNVVNPLVNAQQNPYKVLTAFQDATLKYLPDYTLQSSSRTTVNGQPALELITYNEKKKYYFRWQIFLVDQTVYQLGVATSSEDTSDFTQFTSSFKLTPSQ